MKRADVIQSLEAQKGFHRSLEGIQDPKITQSKSYIELKKISSQLITQSEKIRDRDLPSLNLSLIALAFMENNYNKLFALQTKFYDALIKAHQELGHNLTLPQPLKTQPSPPRVASSHEEPIKDKTYYLSRIESLRERSLLAYNALVEHHEKLQKMMPTHESAFLLNKEKWERKFKENLEQLPLERLMDLEKSWKIDMTSLHQSYGKEKASAKNDQSNPANSTEAYTKASHKRQRMFTEGSQAPTVKSNEDTISDTQLPGAHKKG